MKKFAKMSLVAAVAVAGLTTTSSAKALEEAIKNVDVSGTVLYRYNDYNNDVKSDRSADVNNNYKIGLNLKSKVNDDVTAVTRFIIGSDSNGLESLDTGKNGDTQVSVDLSQVYFSYTGLANTTINVGKQGLTTPWTVAIDADGDEQTGTGILALTNVGPVTFAAAYFNQTNLGESGLLAEEDAIPQGKVGSRNVATLGAMGNIGPVALDAWYLDMDDLFDTFTIGANAKFDLDPVKLGVDARYTSLDFDANSNDNKLYKIKFTANMGIFNAALGYAGTDSEGGLVALEDSAKTAYETWNIKVNNKADADMFHAVLGANVLPNLNISANWANVEYDVSATDNTEVEEEELYAQFKYQMSKNFKGYLRYGTYEKDTGSTEDNDETRGRIQVQYSF